MSARHRQAKKRAALLRQLADAAVRVLAPNLAIAGALWAARAEGEARGVGAGKSGGE